MIKNKAIHAMIIGSCLFINSMAGVYADTANPDETVSIQIQQVNYDEALLQKQSEIDQYVFEKHAKDFADKGITVTNTGVIGDFVEIGITPLSKENADYIYEIFGKEDIMVVEGIQAVTFAGSDTDREVTVQYPAEIAEANIVSAPAEKEASPIATFFSGIWEWIKNIF